MLNHCQFRNFFKGKRSSRDKKLPFKHLTQIWCCADDYNAFTLQISVYRSRLKIVWDPVKVNLGLKHYIECNLLSHLNIFPHTQAVSVASKELTRNFKMEQ